MSPEHTPPPPRIVVSTSVRHPRLRYVLRLVGDDLGYHFVFENTSSRLPSTGTSDIVVGYGGGEQHAPAFFNPHPLLEGKDTAPLGFPGPPTPQTEYAPPDPQRYPLAAIFWTVSRYEEYAAGAARDDHDRFPATASYAHRKGHLHRPLVREWTARIGDRLRKRFPTLPPPRRYALEVVPTYDVDLMYAFHHRGWRGWANLLRDALTGRGDRALARLRSRPKTDPYNTFAWLEELHERHKLDARYFWLLTDRGDPHDPNPYPIPSDQLEMMHGLDRGKRCGLHPGYQAGGQAAQLAAEKQRIENILGRRVDRSRQHYVRLRLPATYRTLLDGGIRHDYSMGYADATGWRAGTNLPFRWYDLEREQETPLWVHPFAAMDVTLKNYLDLTAEGAARRVTELAEGLRPYGGPLTLLWHNSSFAADYGWAGWREMYADLLRRLTADRTGS